MDQAAACPRCGYDQSGAVAAWEKIEPPACPLEGVCSECGLGFAWVDVFRPGLWRVRGFYEHARGPWQQRAWAFVTLWWTVLPWRFWRRVSLEHAPSRGRASVWLLGTSIWLWIVGSLAANAAHWVVVSWSPYWRGPRSDTLSIMTWLWIWPLNGHPRWFDPPSWLRAGLPLIAAAAAWPLVLTLLARSRREARVSRGHILRATVYSLAFVQFALLLRLIEPLWNVGNMVIEPRLGFWPGDPEFSPLQYFQWHPPLGRSLLLAWLLLWWYWALRRGFRLERARTIWALLACIAVLVAVLTEISLMPWYLWWILG